MRGKHAQQRSEEAIWRWYAVSHKSGNDCKDSSQSHHEHRNDSRESRSCHSRAMST
jgi:hypothetical protein